MKAGGYLDTATDLHNPDFAAMAKVVGFTSFRVEDSQPEGDADPGAGTPRSGTGGCTHRTQRADHAAESTDAGHRQGLQPVLLKAVLNGRGDEVVELARTNLR